MALDERKAILGAAPTGTPLFYREERLPIAAANDAGENVTARLTAADRAAVGPAHVDPNFIGLARPFSVTVTFDRPIDRGAGRPVLLVDGWVEYPYAQTVFAAWQAGAVYEPPTLEARDVAVAGTWWRRVRLSRRHAAADGVAAADPAARHHRAPPPYLTGDLLGPHRRGLRGTAPRRGTRCCRFARRGSKRVASRAAPRDRSARPTTMTTIACPSTTRDTPEAGIPVRFRRAARGRRGPRSGHLRAGRGGGATSRRPSGRAGGVDSPVRARGPRLVQGHGPLHAGRRDHRAAPGKNTAARARLHPRFNTRYAAGY